MITQAKPSCYEADTCVKKDLEHSCSRRDTHFILPVIAFKDIRRPMLELNQSQLQLPLPWKTPIAPYKPSTSSLRQTRSHCGVCLQNLWHLLPETLRYDLCVKYIKDSTNQLADCL